MPTYVYRCTADGCTHEFETFQRMSDKAEAACPTCGAASERKLSGGAGFLFKGSGFYITDYRSDGYKKAAKADSEKGSSGSNGKSSEKKPSEPKASSKPAAKSE